MSHFSGSFGGLTADIRQHYSLTLSTLNICLGTKRRSAILFSHVLKLLNRIRIVRHLYNLFYGLVAFCDLNFNIHRIRSLRFNSLDSNVSLINWKCTENF
jgi:hypothetical protein